MAADLKNFMNFETVMAATAHGLLHMNRQTQWHGLVPRAAVEVFMVVESLLSERQLAPSPTLRPSPGSGPSRRRLAGAQRIYHLLVILRSRLPVSGTSVSLTP